jgi:hypothetical protein
MTSYVQDNMGHYTCIASDSTDGNSDTIAFEPLSGDTRLVYHI